jgi:hypothetical protein
MTWHDVKAHRSRSGLTVAQFAALVVRRDWHVTVSPYSVSERGG